MNESKQPAPYGHYDDINADDTASRFNKSFAEGITNEERVKHYDTWASTYDQDMKTYGFTGPEIAVEYLRRYFKDTSGTYLDCGSGTGLLGVHIKSLGYTNFHALDASSVALEKAKSRGAYSHFIQEYITTGRLSMESDVYDGLICCACFVPGHLEPDCVEDWSRIVKPGGVVIIVMNKRWIDVEPAYNEGKLEGAFKKRVDEGKWEQVTREQRDGYFTTDPAEIFVFRVKNISSDNDIDDHAKASKLRLAAALDGGMTDSERTKHYDSWSKNYDQDMMHFGFRGPQITAEYIERYFTDRNATYLECGSGTGLLGIELKRLGYTNFHALDASSVSLEKARSRDAYSHFINELVTPGRLSMESDVYDGLVCVACFADANMEPNCVEDWSRIVKPGGVVIIVMNGKYLDVETHGITKGTPLGAFQKRVDEGKWEWIAKEERGNYRGSTEAAAILVFRVIQNGDGSK